MNRVLSGLGYGGLGITLSFLLIILTLPSYTAMKALYPIYLTGLIAGFLYGCFKGKANAGGVSFVLGFGITTLLYLIWLNFTFNLAYSLSLLATAIVVMWIVSSEDTLDIALTPFSYFGGFILGNLLFSKVELYKVEGSVMSIFMSGVIGAVVVLSISLFKAFVENTRTFGRRKNNL